MLIEFLRYRTKYSLNALSHDAAIGLIRRTLADGVKLTEVYIDILGTVLYNIIDIGTVLPLECSYREIGLSNFSILCMVHCHMVCVCACLCLGESMKLAKIHHLISCYKYDCTQSPLMLPSILLFMTVHNRPSCYLIHASCVCKL